MGCTLPVASQRVSQAEEPCDELPQEADRGGAAAGCDQRRGSTREVDQLWTPFNASQMVGAQAAVDSTSGALCLARRRSIVPSGNFFR